MQKNGRSLQQEADRIVLGHHSPPGVLVDNGLEIVHFRGRTQPYIELSSGKASLNPLKMARRGLASELRSAIAQAAKRSLFNMVGAANPQISLFNASTPVPQPTMPTIWSFLRTPRHKNRKAGSKYLLLTLAEIANSANCAGLRRALKSTCNPSLRPKKL